MFLLPLLAQIAKTKATPPPEGVWKYIDAANEVVSNPNFDAAIASPWFWVGSIAVVVVSLLRGWKALLIGYVGAVVMWAIVHKVVLSDTSSGAGSSSTIVFAALTVGVAGLAIYFLLIRD